MIHGRARGRIRVEDFFAARFGEDGKLKVAAGRYLEVLRNSTVQMDRGPAARVENQRGLGAEAPHVQRGDDKI